MAREMVTPIVAILPRSTSIKITGWSVEFKEQSLLDQLTALGDLTSYIHYPQMNTTYVDIRTSNNQSDLFKAIAGIIPKARVEVGSYSDIQDTERLLENPGQTAFISSKYFISEVEIYEKLKSFGCIRALNLSFSLKYNKWYCKISYYEKFSLNQLITSKISSISSLGNEKHLKIEKFRRAKGSNELKNNKITNSRDILELKKNVEYSTNFDQKQLIPDQGISSHFTEASAKLAKRLGKGKSRLSKSSSRTPAENLPSTQMFSNKKLYLENVFSILKSLKNQKSVNCINTLRSKSLDIHTTKQNSIKITFPCKKESKNTSYLIKKTFRFAPNELLFLEIDKKHNTNFNMSIKKASEVEPSEIYKCDTSFLSQSDKSDGYTALENSSSFRLDINSIKLTHRSQDSAKDNSLVVFTKHSSDAKNSIPENYCYRTRYPDHSNIDTLFQSHSDHKDRFGVNQPILADNSNHFRSRISFFAFPCI